MYVTQFPSMTKPSRASSCEVGKEASKAADENTQSWWRAASNEPGEWLEIDLKHVCDLRAVQINFADDQLDLSFPNGVTPMENGVINITKRYLDERMHVTRWLLEGSIDGEDYFVMEDKSCVDSDLSHDFVVKEEGLKARYIKCTVKELPYNQHTCISGLRVFGIGEGEHPEQVSNVQTKLLSELDLSVAWESDSALGFNVLWGFAPDKLYHSYMVFERKSVQIGALIKGQSLYVRVDAFNEVGITEGEVRCVIE
ncbi:discoidin domain-containing protein [Paenibacillus oryzisoli]|uniref:F5/8 type C domain-containing protein n=1 Tax=Paenibacillus oryzisoli TaxID=1850517 RepID=A0A198A8P4_9BACL|nr:discoidin domain-containing protein [Paenibacillus oryzisoli]OAS17839.1 hypothetical protein A8708_27855 [Paenibacillus oryzisoli]